MYSITAIRITSGEELKHRNGDSGLLIVRGYPIAEVVGPSDTPQRRLEAVRDIARRADRIAVLPRHEPAMIAPMQGTRAFAL